MDISLMATDKAKIMTYCDKVVKTKIEQLAENQNRSLSNFVELLLKKAIAEAERSGELPEE